MEYKLTQDIRMGKIESAYVAAPFDMGKKALESQGYEIISLEQNVNLIILEGKNSFISKNGNWTREGIIYIPKKGVYLTKKSPIMENVKRATNQHRNGQDYYLTNEQVEKALEYSIEISKKELPQKEIHTSKFLDNEITVFAFGDVAGEYGKLLGEAGISDMVIWFAPMQYKAFARQLWFSRLGYRSGFGGLDWSLIHGGGGLNSLLKLRGVK